ncbi:MAG TPA: hypothetical protein PLK31_25335, partial [Chloroflexota bacterium]|nr:hypothetical protein [Chloroflexota bacterium]
MFLQSQRVRRLFINFLDILALMWQANPVALAGVILLNILQGLLPLMTAWVTKLLFDLLAQRLAGETTFVWPSLLWLIAAQTVLLLAGQLVTPLAAYFKAELNRQLSLTIQTNIYQKID